MELREGKEDISEYEKLRNAMVQENKNFMLMTLSAAGFEAGEFHDRIMKQSTAFVEIRTFAEETMHYESGRKKNEGWEMAMPLCRSARISSVVAPQYV